MKFKNIGIAALAVAATVALTGSTLVGDTRLHPFTETELGTNWEADRTFPSDGVTSVAAHGRTNVARIGIDSSNPSESGLFHLTEGIKTVGVQDFGQAVQVDLYLDPAWEGNATRAGVWVVGDADGTGAAGDAGRDQWYGIIEFVNNDDHEGWRIWDSSAGWETLSTPFSYGEWVTLSITLDTDAAQYSYAIDGEMVGTAPGGTHYIREVFLNSFNFGSTTMTSGLTTDSYAAHWHAGHASIDPKDQCTDGSWEAAGFKNQGQCIKFISTGVDSR